MTAVTGLALAAAVATSPAFGQRRSAAPASIFASVGHSEWCRAGSVRLDLATGRYILRAPATWRTCRRPTWRTAVRASVLTAGELRAVRGAWRRADAEGLTDPACGRRGETQRIVIDNGGTPILRITRRGRTVAPPGNQGCWNEAALQLHSSLRELFDPRPRR